MDKTRIYIVAFIMAAIGIFTLIANARSEPSQQFNNVRLNPNYFDTLPANTNRTMYAEISPPDGLSKINSALFRFSIFTGGSTTNYTLYVNGKLCGNFYVSTTYANSGQYQISFDCTNLMQAKGNYTIHLKSSVNAGSVFGQFDITYRNSPKGDIDFKGTEYYVGEKGTMFLQLKDSSGHVVDNGSCDITVYNPDLTHTVFISEAPMIYKAGSEGLYYYDFTVPSQEGVYMAGADCSYYVMPVWYYGEESTSYPNRTVVAGTYTGDTLVLNSYCDNLYTQCSSGGGKICDANYVFIMDSGNISTLDLYYMGESSGAPTQNFYVWNWTANNWYKLPNSLTFTGTAGVDPSGIDEYMSNSIPNLAQTIAPNGTVIIKLNSTSTSSFNLFSNWLTLKANQMSSYVSELRGASELNVHPRFGESALYTVSTMCQQLNTSMPPTSSADSSCSMMVNDTDYNLPQGALEDNVTVNGQINMNNTYWTYTTPYEINCIGTYSIKTNISGVWTDIYNSTYKDGIMTVSSQEPARHGSCDIRIPINITVGSSQSYIIRYDNTQKYKVMQDMVLVDVVKSTSPLVCDPYAYAMNYTFTVPITASMNISTDLLLRQCHESADLQYRAYTYYNQSILTNMTIGEYTSIYEEIDGFITSKLMSHFSFLLGYIANQTASGIASLYGFAYYANQSLSGQINGVPSAVWSYPNRTLTDFDFTVNTTLDLSPILSAMQDNFTYTNGLVNGIGYNLTQVNDSLYSLAISEGSTIKSYIISVNGTVLSTNSTVDYWGRQNNETSYTLFDSLRAWFMSNILAPIGSWISGNFTQTNSMIEQLDSRMGGNFTQTNGLITSGIGYIDLNIGNNFTQTNANMLAVNSSIFGKLYLIQDEIASVNNSVLAVGINLTEINQTLIGQIGQTNNLIQDLSNNMYGNFTVVNGKLDGIGFNLTNMNGTLYNLTASINGSIISTIINVNSTLPEDIWIYPNRTITSIVGNITNVNVVNLTTEVSNEVALQVWQLGLGIKKRFFENCCGIFGGCT